MPEGGDPAKGCALGTHPLSKAWSRGGSPSPPGTGRVWAELPTGSDSPLGLLEGAAEGEPSLACFDRLKPPTVGPSAAASLPHAFSRNSTIASASTS